jgi:uncharacterized 2Fe-2S/4Fe-4S cluster protein (DUF4445 family)
LRLGYFTALSEMLNAGILDQRGALRRSDPRVRVANGKSEFVLVPAPKTAAGRDLVITRGDVNEIQLAKGAIRAGIEILMAEVGINAAQVEAWIIAGAFGTYLDLSSAMRLGMFPTAPLERFHQVGNAAGVGAKQMLLSRTRRLEASQLAARAGYVELTIYPQFTEKFVESMYFG